MEKSLNPSITDMYCGFFNQSSFVSFVFKKVSKDSDWGFYIQGDEVILEKDPAGIDLALRIKSKDGGEAQINFGRDSLR